MDSKRVIIGIAGGSGAILAKKIIKELASNQYFVDLVISRAGLFTITHELGPKFKTAKNLLSSFTKKQQNFITYHQLYNFGATIASGSYPTRGMIIVPCSMSTLAAVSCGLSDNLLRRAADVVIKEKRKLVIVPRESPMSEIHLENLLKLAKIGATIIPPIPAWYNLPKSLDEAEDHLVGRILEAIGISLPLYPHWQGI